MKLIKKLLPISALSTSVIALMPIVTSCAASKSWKVGEKFKPTVEQIAGEYTEEQMLDRYVEDVNKKNMILVEDFLWNSYLSTEIFIEYRITNLTITLNKVDVQNKTFSYTEAYTIQIGDKISNEEAIITNFPYLMKYKTGIGFGMLGNEEKLKNDSDWKIEYKGEYIPKIVGADHFDKSSATNEFYAVVRNMFVNSYYLYNCKLLTKK